MQKQVVVWEAGDSMCKCLTRLLLLMMPPEATADAISDHRQRLALGPHLCHRGLSKSVKSRTCRSSDARPAGPMPPY